MIKKLFVYIVLGLAGLGVIGTANAQSVTTGYASDQPLERGMIVGLEKSSTDKVEAIGITKINSILGVVVDANDSPITLSDKMKNVFVATSDTFDVLVSDQQGAISVGDYITTSALSGIGMKATDREGYVLGKATAAYDGKSNTLSTSTLSSGSGSEQAVHIARIAVKIEISRNPLSKDGNGAPLILNKISTAVVGKEASAVRLYIASVILIMGLLIAGAVVYAGVRSSIISIGRNPLSKSSILHSMIGVVFTSIVIVLISILSVYLLLRV